MSDPQPTWRERLNSLDVSRRAAAESLRAQFSALGVTDPADLIESEVMEDLPQLARSALLRSLWLGAIDGWTEPGSLDQLPAAQGLLAAGADREDLVRLVRAVACEAVFATLGELDAGGDVSVSGVENEARPRRELPHRSDQGGACDTRRAPGQDVGFRCDRSPYAGCGSGSLCGSGAALAAGSAP